MRRLSAPFLSSCSSPSWAPSLRTQQAPQPLRIHFVDVGQGDGMLIQSPLGPDVVYDGGENPSRMRDYLTSVGVSRVGLVIASHNHADHIGGLIEVVRQFPAHVLHGQRRPGNHRNICDVTASREWRRKRTAATNKPSHLVG